MEKKVRARWSLLAMIAPIGACLIVGVLTYNVAARAGYPPILAAMISGTIGLLWLGFFVSRLLG